MKKSIIFLMVVAMFSLSTPLVQADEPPRRWCELHADGYTYCYVRGLNGKKKQISKKLVPTCGCD